MSTIDNINGIYAKDTELRNGISELRGDILSQTIKPLSITKNGTYTSDPTVGAYGYSPVIVDTGYHLPDGYTQLDYVECPQSAWAGFTIPNYTYKGYDILESKTMPYQVTTLAAFAGYKTSGIVLGYENSTTRLYAGQNAVDLIGTQEATVNNIYYHRGLKTVDISEFNVGYYRDDNYPFYGRIYYFRIYRCDNTSEGISMIYNFIPAKRLSDNKIGLYDAVNDTFYSSTTGTEFVAPSV